MNNAGDVLTPAFNWVIGDVLGMAIDADSSSILWFRNGVQIYQTSGITTPKPWYIGAGGPYKPSAAGLKFNFGQSAFRYAVPAGYAAGVGSAAN